MELLVLDDTGSSILSLNYPNYLFYLDISRATLCMSPRWKLKQLAEGIQEYDPSQINFKDGNGAYMGKWERSYCLLTPGRDETRLSGMYIRSTDIVQLMTVGTPPSGNFFFIRQSLVTCFFFYEQRALSFICVLRTDSW